MNGWVRVSEFRANWFIIAASVAGSTFWEGTKWGMLVVVVVMVVVVVVVVVELELELVWLFVMAAVEALDTPDTGLLDGYWILC